MVWVAYIVFVGLGAVAVGLMGVVLSAASTMFSDHIKCASKDPYLSHNSHLLLLTINSYSISLI